LKYGNTGLDQLIPPDGVSKTVCFLYKREIEPELVT